MRNLNLENGIKIIIDKFKKNEFDFVIENSSFLLKKFKKNDLLWMLQGVSYFYKNDKILSIESLKKALEINPNNVDARNYLGIVYKKLNNFEKSEKCYLDCLKIDPNYFSSLLNLGNLKIITNHFDEAISFYKKALKINENIEEIYINLAHAYQSTKQFKKAKLILNKCLNKFPMSTKADRLLSSQINFANNQDYLSLLLKKFDKKKLNKEQIVNLSFAIGKAFEDKKNFKESFKYYFKGNSIEKNSLKSNIKQKTEVFNKIKLFFSNFNLHNKNTCLDKERKIIFIFGLPRSGTTLIENIISSHDKVSSTGEINFINKFFNDKEIISSDLNHFLDLDLKKKYLNFIKLFKLENEIITDKSLNNYFYLGFIKHYFPGSKLIHCKRSAKDNCLSIYKNLFIDSQYWKYDEKELVEYYYLYKNIMEFWNNKMKKEILNIEYENLIHDKEKTIRKIIEHCELKWNKKCLHHHKNNISIRTLSNNQAHKPIYSSSINSYKNYEIYLKKMFNSLN